MIATTLNHPSKKVARAVMRPEDFERIAAFAHSQAGLRFFPQKAPMIESRIGKRLRQLGLTTFEDYCTLIEDPAEHCERQELISALTTNVTSFFREPQHFVTLKANVIPALLERLRSGNPVRIWSAGCSKGHEPYSLAISFLEAEPNLARYDFRILATDIDTKVLKIARDGLYLNNDMAGLTREQQSQYFRRMRNGLWKISGNARDLVRFNPLNLTSDWPMKTRFDVVFCRNVVIYFDQATQDRLWPKFEAVTRNGGWLFIGHSERLTKVAAPGFVSAGATTYQKKHPGTGSGRA